MSLDKNLKELVKEALTEVLTEMGLADKLVDRQAPLEDHEQNVEKAVKKVAKKAAKKVEKKVEPEPEIEVEEEEEVDPFLDVSDEEVEAEELTPKVFFDTLIAAVGDKKNKDVDGPAVAKACFEIAETSKVKEVKDPELMQKVLDALKLS